MKTKNGYRWQAAKKTFLFPVKLLSKDFRKAFCAGVRELLETGELDTEFGRLDVQAMLKEAESKNWEVYIQPPIAGIDNLLDRKQKCLFGRLPAIPVFCFHQCSPGGDYMRVRVSLHGLPPSVQHHGETHIAPQVFLPVGLY